MASLLVSFTTSALPAKPSTNHLKDSNSVKKIFSLNENVKQLVVTIVENKQATSGTLFTFERATAEDGELASWQQYKLTTDVVVGKNGIAWGIGLHPDQKGEHKKEGDGKAPSGLFEFGTAFGYLPNVQTHLPYVQMNASDYCIDVNDSPYYNQIVSTNLVGKQGVKGSSEPMRRDIHLNDPLYKKGIVIKHNVNNVRAGGSCIFMHIWRENHKPTAGCTAMSETALDQVLSWLDKVNHPVYLLLTKGEYLLYQQAWQLPAINFTASSKLIN
ncbi:L,D-transpeptidase family protein [Thalassotalea piscium]